MLRRGGLFGVKRKREYTVLYGNTEEEIKLKESEKHGYGLSVFPARDKRSNKRSV